MLELFMTTVMPRAKAMMNAAPMKSPMPDTMLLTMPSSPRRPSRPTITAPTRNRAASSGKYQPSVMVSRDSLKSDHGITEKIISTKVSMKTQMTAFWPPVISGGSSSPSAASSSSPGCATDSDLDGSPFTFIAYRST